MATDVKCPSCGTTFPIEEVMNEEYKKQLRDQMNVFVKEKTEEFRLRQEELGKQSQQQQVEFEKKLAEQKVRLQQEIMENTRKNVAGEFENKIKMLEEAKKNSDEKIKLAREKELDFLKKEQELKNKEAELEIVLQRRLQEERNVLTEQIRKQETEKNSIRDNDNQLRFKEYEKQLEDQKKLIDEMKRKAEQGSMQLQGEVQELILEEMLRSNFPFDVISEVGKGVRGADCIQTIRNNFGQECGRIIYESKRTSNFSIEWIEKLKKDMRSMGVDVAVIVTQCYPKGMDCFGEMNGVWICSFDEAKAVAYVLRDSIIKLYSATRSQENKGDKMHMLYDYLTGTEFSEQWKAIREGFLSMRLSLQKERDAMEKLWKVREKQLDKVLLNATHIGASVEGIAGSDKIHLSLTDEEDDALLLE